MAIVESRATRITEDGYRSSSALVNFIQNKSDLLDLHSWKLSTIPFDLIEEYVGNNVTALDLSYNRIKSIPCEFLLRFSSLKHLSLRANFLKELPDNFGKLSRLVFLDVSFNEVSKVILNCIECRIPPNNTFHFIN